MNTYLKIADSIGNFFTFIPVILISYLVIINIVSFSMFYADKQKAKKHLWRIPESTLIISALIGGSFGAFAAMKLFRHKTKHAKFYILIPVFMVLHIFIIVTGIIGIVR